MSLDESFDIPGGDEGCVLVAADVAVGQERKTGSKVARFDVFNDDDRGSPTDQAREVDEEGIPSVCWHVVHDVAEQNAIRAFAAAVDILGDTGVGTQIHPWHQLGFQETAKRFRDIDHRDGYVGSQLQEMVGEVSVTAANVEHLGALWDVVYHRPSNLLQIDERGPID